MRPKVNGTSSAIDAIDQPMKLATSNAVAIWAIPRLVEPQPMTPLWPT
jgi:hypothetical protein